jgi:hypothetical protein
MVCPSCVNFKRLAQGDFTVLLDWQRTPSRWDNHQQTGAAAGSPT